MEHYNTGERTIYYKRELDGPYNKRSSVFAEDFSLTVLLDTMHNKTVVDQVDILSVNKYIYIYISKYIYACVYISSYVYSIICITKLTLIKWMLSRYMYIYIHIGVCVYKCTHIFYSMQNTSTEDKLDILSV